MTLKEFLDTNLAGALILIAMLAPVVWWHGRQMRKLRRQLEAISRRGEGKGQ